jgi:UTP--glucose-1-phosphate uridylyltransferase
MNRKIRKAVFPIGGLGTRFLPVTKALPKEMLPVANKPLIQHAFEEAVAAGIEDFIFITGRNKNIINNHFDHSYELQNILNERDKQAELDMTKSWLPKAGHIAFVRQQEPLGLGHAVWCARNFIGDEPFAVLLADEMLMTDGGFLNQMCALYQETGASVVAVAEVDKHLISNYGIVDVAATSSQHQDSFLIKGMVEKPSPDLAPSNLSITGRYILTPDIFDYLVNAKQGAAGEIQLTDSMHELAQNKDFYALQFKGPRFDCGNYVGFVEANIAYSLEGEHNTKIAEMLKKYI